mgnify:CR=1 FL=1
MCCPAPLFFFDVLGSNWGQNQFFCKKAKKYSAENDVFSALFLVAGARFELTTFGLWAALTQVQNPMQHNHFQTSYTAFADEMTTQMST